MKILFQGDSITDVRRNHETPDASWMMGCGYATVVGAVLGEQGAGEYQFYNRGISGNRIVDVYARIRNDIINLKPDYMSLLIGVNDVWHEDRQNGVDAEKFEKIYRMLIDEIKAALPDIKLMLLGAFVTDGWEIHDRYDTFRAEVEKRAEATRRIANDYGLKFVDLQSAFDAACEKAPASYWTLEGVHPNAPGHGVIAKEWLKAFEDVK